MKQSLLNAMKKGTVISLKIDSNPIVLIPHTRVKKQGGVYDWVEQPPRDSQNLGVEANSSTLSGVTGTSGGLTGSDGATMHKWDYEIYGPVDAQIEIGDTWENGGTTYRVTSIKPFNGYERRGTVSAIGGDPSYGS